MSQPPDYSEFFEHLPVACLVLDRHGKFHLLNQQAAKLLGTTRPVSVACGLDAFVCPASLADLQAFLERVFAEPGEQSCELSLAATATRPALWVRLVASSDQDGERCRVVVSDITASKRVEEKLRASEALLSAGARIAGLGCWEWDMRGDQFYLSEENQRIHGCASPKRTMAELMPLAHPDDWPAIQHAFQQASTQGIPYEIEHRILREDTGEVRFVKAYGEAICDESGRPVKLFGACQDITEAKRAEEALRASEEKYRRLYEGMRDAFVSVDMERRITECNQAFVDMLGYSAEELATMTYLDLTPAPRHDEDADIERQVMSQGFSRLFEKEYRRKDGTVFPVELRAILIRDKEGRPQGQWGIVRDITERKQARQALRESEERFRLIAQVAPVPLVVVRLADHISLYANPLAAELAGLDQTGMTGRKATEFYAEPEQRDRMIEALKREGVVRNREMLFKRADGTCFWGLYSAALAHLDNEEVVISSVKDISERKRTEDALRESEERYRALVTASSQIVWRCDPEGKLLDVSEGWADLTGQTETQLKGGEWMESIHPDDRLAAEQAQRLAFVEGKPFHTELRVRAKDGSYRWLRGYGVPIYAADGRIKEWVGASADVTEYKLIGNALREREAQLSTLTASVPAILWSADGDGVVNYASQAYFDFTGLPPESLASGEWVHMIHPDDRDWVVATWRQAVREGYAPPVEYRVMRADGSFRWFKGEAEPTYDEQGRIIKWFGSIVDIDGPKQLEAELVKRDRLKDEFLAMLAHELQNPLAPILIAAQLLESRGREDAELFEWAVGAISHEAKHLSRLVSELLDVARVTQGKINLKKGRFDLREVVKRVVEIKRLLIGGDGQQILCQAPAAPVMVEADKTRIEQVLGNLLSNAMKYTPDGGLISVSLARDGEFAELRVRDNGIGIPPDQLADVFGLFSQIGSSLERSNGGLGIGLALAKRLIEKHGGSIEAHSEGLGLGSEFVLRLPALPPADEELGLGGGTSALPPQVRARVLVVDDNEMVRTALGLLVESMGCEVFQAGDGLKALDVARSQPLDLALLDIGLPGMDGFELARQLRQMPGLAGLKLVAVSGYNLGDDRRSADGGFDHHLTKPVDADQLAKILGSL